MKKCKTLLSIFLCIMACAVFGIAGCTQRTVSVGAIAIIGFSDNVEKEEGADRYLVRKGETFSITYEIMPENANELTTYIELTPANRISTKNTIIRSNTAKNTVEFTASSTNIGETIIRFQTKDGGETDEVRVEIIDDTRIFSTPQDVKYGYNSTSRVNEFSWTPSTVDSNSGLVNAKRYKIFINEEEHITTTPSYAMELESGVDYYVQVQALGELKERTSDSERTSDTRFIRANTPKNFKANNGILTWEYEDEETINGFVLEYGAEGKEFINDPHIRSFNLASYVDSEDLGKFNVKITAVNSDFANGALNGGIPTYVLNSVNNPTLTLTQLGAPANTTINNQKQAGDIYSSSMLEWDAVTSASSYILTIYKNNQEIGQIINNSNFINLSKAEFIQDAVIANDVAEYRIEITAQGDTKTTFGKLDSTASIEFVVLPFLYGTVNYNTDILNLLTADLLTLLELNPEDLASNLKYEVYYSENVTGAYDNAIEIANPTSAIHLSNLIDLTTSYNVLVRPVVKDGYTTKNTVLPMLRDINFNKTTTSMITQLKTVIINNVDTDGVVSATDINLASNVESYRFELTGDATATQTVYRNNSNLNFDGSDFTISLVQLFNINSVGNYNVKIIPVSSKMLDANENNCTNYAFKQLGSVDTSTIAINNNVVTWGAVANYSSYTIKINDTEEIVNSNSYSVEDVTILEDQNSITITVNGNGTNTISGKSVTVTKARASVVNGFKVEDGVLTWNDDIVGSTYYITITYPQENEERIVVNTNSYSGLDKIATTATITVSRGVTTAFNSVESDDVVLTRLNTPLNDMTIVNHTTFAELSAVENATTYNLVIKKGADVIKEMSINSATEDVTITSEKVSFNIGLINAGEYSLFVQAIPSNQGTAEYESNQTFYLISDVSQNSDFVAYPEIAITGKTHQLNWSFASNYSVKEFTITDTNNGIEDVITTDYSHKFSDIDAGEYQLTISVSSTADNVIYSRPTAVTIVKTATPSISYNKGTIKFTVVPTAKEYKVYDSNDNMLILDTDYKMTVEGNTATIQPLNLQEGTQYGIYIVAIGDTDIIDGNKSNIVNFSIIEKTSEFTLNNKVFTWKAITGNSGYIVTLKKGVTILENTTITTNSYTIPGKYFAGEDLFEAGQYELSVVVLSDTLINSAPATITFTKLDVISEMNLTDNTITWQYTGVGTPKEFRLAVLTYDEDTWVQQAQYTIAYVTGVTPSFELTQLDEYDDFAIRIMCVGDDAQFTLNGEVKQFKFGDATEVFTKISAPSFTYTNGKIQLVGSEDAERYELYSFDGVDSYSLLTSEYTLDADMYIDLTASGETYTIVAKAIATADSGKLNSLYSSAVKIHKLVAESNLEVNTSGYIVWTINENAKKYIVHNITNGKSNEVDGTNSNNISYEKLYQDQELELGSTNEFAIQLIGDAKDGINYLNSEISNSVQINAISSVDRLTIKNGVMSWDAIEGVSSYRVEVVRDNNAKLKTLVVNTNTLNINGFQEIANGYTANINVIPFATESSQYIIVDAVTTATLKVHRYNIIKGISIENGLLKFRLDVSELVTNPSDIEKILGTNDFSQLEQDFQQKYYGYYNFNINVEGLNSSNISLADMYYEADPAQLILSRELTATYQLGYNVTERTLLNLKISSIGNEGNSEVEYSAIGSLPSTSNKTILSVYKFPAPQPTANDNLIGEDGKITFKKINGVDKYILTAVSVSQNSETLTTIINTSLSNGVTYVTENLSAILFDVQGSNAQKRVDGDVEYIYTLTTLGTESGSTGTLYLRSNPYKETSVIFLSSPSFDYEYSSDTNTGGHVSWTKNPKAIKYRIYALNPNEVNDGSDKESVRNNTTWIQSDKPYANKVYMCDIAPEEGEYFFENGGFYRGVGIDKEEDVNLPNGSYWVAIKAIGDEVNTITNVSGSNTLEIYKVSSVVNQELKDGTFNWTISDADAMYVTGFQVTISVFTNNGKGATSKVLRPALIPIVGGSNVKYSYTLEETLVDEEGLTFSFTGVGADNEVEAYGISVVAIGGNVNERYCVNAAPVLIDNDDFGYLRLSAVELTANQAAECLQWTETGQSLENVAGYQLFVNSNKTADLDNFTNVYSFKNNIFAVADDYDIYVKAIAKKSNYLNSVGSNTLKVIKFNDPNLVAKNGVLNWDNEYNNVAHQPLSSNLVITQSANGVDNFSEVYNEIREDFVYELSDEDTFNSGYYYNVKVRYNGFYDEANMVYYIASNEMELLTYKVNRPVIQEVYNFLTDQVDERECPEFDSCVKWPIVTDEKGDEVKSYEINFYIFDGYEFKIDTELTIVIPDISNNSGYSHIFVVRDGCVYFNITDLGNNPDVVSTVQVVVKALGVTDEYAEKNQLNSSNALKEMDYSDIAPDVTDTDRENGIIRWTGSENPVYITLQYGPAGNEVTEKVLLTSEYIEKYGKIYYLPYMARYKVVELQFIKSGCLLGNTAEIKVADQSLFAEGSGTKEDPYIINSANQLTNLQYRPLSYIEIDKNVSTLTMSGTWTPLERFGGVLDGNNVTISNISLGALQELQGGQTYIHSTIFKMLMAGGEIKNINFSFSTSVGHSTMPYRNPLYLAGIVTTNDGTINNVTLSGNISAYSQTSIWYGGVAIYNRGMISNVKFGISALGVGPLISNLYCTPITNTISSVRAYGGGITYSNTGIIDQCSYSGSLSINSTVTTKRAGGISVLNKGIILNSDFTGTLNSFDMAGITVENSFDSLYPSFTMEKVYIINGVDVVESYEYLGGTILGCYSEGSFNLSSGSANHDIYVAGIAGRNTGGIVGRCYAIVGTANSTMDFSSKKVSGKYAYVGGLVGLIDVNDNAHQPRLENSYAIVNTAFVDSSGAMNRGAVIGNCISKLGSSVNYTNNYGVNSVAYCSTLPASSITGLTAELKSLQEINTSQYRDLLNTVASGDEKYVHIREFILGSTSLTLKLQKTIKQ